MNNSGAEPDSEDVGRGRVEALSDGVFAMVVTCYGAIALYFVFPHSVRARGSREPGILPGLKKSGLRLEGYVKPRNEP